MRENLTEIVFILDRSGSMSQLESDTIGGFNSMIAKQKKKEGEAIVSTVLFDDEIDVIHDRVPIRDVKELTDEDHYVGGYTALLDAIGMAEKMGISQDYAANYHCDEIGMSLNYEVLEEAVTRVRNCKTEEISKVFSDGEWKKDIDHDYKKRARNNLISD